VVYSPAGCVHNGNKAVCTFVLANQGNAVTLQAPWQMNILQFVDDAHVPHLADSAYFVDSYGTRQEQLFVNKGESGTLIREFPNVDEHVASGEFHLRDQVVGGIPVGAPGTLPGQVPTTTAAGQPAPANAPATSTSGDPTDKVQQTIDQANSKKQKAIDTWKKLKGLGK
jgi:hypothetical protein